MTSDGIDFAGHVLQIGKQLSATTFNEDNYQFNNDTGDVFYSVIVKTASCSLLYRILFHITIHQISAYKNKGLFLPKQGGPTKNKINIH